MALNIKSKEADRLARELAKRTGESITEAVTKALEERLSRQRDIRRGGLREELEAIRERVSRLPVRDTRSDDEILGYNKDGIWD